MNLQQKENLLKELHKILPDQQISQDVLLASHTSFGIGGPADFLLRVGKKEELKKVLSLCRTTDCPKLVLGRGTNILFRDKGYRGIIIRLAGSFEKAAVKNSFLKAGGGCLLSEVATLAAEQSLTGMEFSYGIPGTVGGGVVMNAGAYGKEMQDLVTEVQTMDERSVSRTYSGREMDFSYRSSILQEKEEVVTAVTFALKRGCTDNIRQKTEELQKRRWEKQPLDLPSAGSFFKRPEGHYAGALIEKAGLKGYGIGGAQVSEKHAGFIVNRRNATAEEVIKLMDYVQKEVFRKFKVKLSPEIKIVGEE